MSGLAFPRLLFVTPAAFNRVTGGGITFTNLFAGWPRDRIATVHSDPVPPSREVCERYFALTSRELRRFPPAGIVPATSPQSPLASARPRHGLMTLAKQALVGNGLPEWGVVTAELKAFIAAFKPELIYTILGGNAMLDLIAAIHEESRAELVVHVMDDWPSAIYRGGLLSFIQRGKMHRRLRQLVAGAVRHLAIGDAMAAEYAARYGVPFTAFQNAVAANPFARPPAERSAIGAPARVIYTGSILGFAQADSLAACCRAVVALRRAGMAIRLDIYSPGFQVETLRSRLAIDDGIEIHETIADDETYFRKLVEADILLLPANFDPASIRYVRLSMPTKVPAYLASGTPILAYGPAALAQIAYARDAGWAHIVDDPSPERLIEGMRSLLADRNLRRRLSDRALVVASSRHDIAVVRRGFQQTLIDAAGQRVSAERVQA